MATGGPTLFQTGVWLILLVPFVTIGGLYLLVRHWRKQTQLDLKQMRGDLRRLQAGFRQLALTMQGHSVDDPEPFGSRVAAFQDQLEHINQQILALEEQHVAIQENMRHLASNRWQATVGAPYFWYLIRQEVTGLRKEREQVEAELAAAEGAGQKVSSLGWEVALQTRETRDLHQQVSRIIGQLRDKNVGGKEMEAALRQEEQHRTALSKVPHYFLNAEESAVLEQANKDDITQVHQVLSNARPDLEDLLAKGQAWEKQYVDASEKVARLRQALSGTEQILAGMPPGILLEPVKTRLDQLNVISQNLHATLGRLEVASMASVSEEAARVYQAAQEIAGELKQARQQQGVLEKILLEVSAGLKQLSAQFSSLGTNPVHPIAWGQGRVTLTHLSKQATAIGPAKKPRSPEALKQDLESATKVNSQLKELTRHCGQIAQQHAELLALLSGPELSQGADWLKNAQKMVARAGEYDPENWPKTDSLSNLPGELHAFAEGLQLLVSASPSELVPEAELAERLENTRELVQFHVRLRGRVEAVASRLEEIQRAEETARNQLQAAQVTLGQAGLLVRSNDFLKDVAGPELGRYQVSLQQASAELDQRQHGSVDKKAKTVSALVAKIEQGLNGWLDQLSKDTEIGVKALSDTLAALESIAPLDEPAVSEAQRLVSTGQSFKSGGRGQKSRLSLEETLLELKRRSDFWQACMAGTHALEDVEKHVIGTYTEASQNRDAAKGQVADIAAWMRSARVWPPISVTLDAERKELDEIEAQWAELKEQRARAISLVAQLSSLSAKYQAVADKARQAGERAVQEQAQVEEIESQLDELMQLWQNQGQSYRDNPAASDEIHRLLNDIEQERGQLKRQYRQASKSYSQVLQELRSIHRKARLAQVSIDDNHVIDVNGRLIAYR